MILKICIDTRWVSKNNSGVGGYIQAILKEILLLEHPYEIVSLGEEVSGYECVNLSGIKKKVFQGLWKTIWWPSLEGICGDVDLVHFTNMTAMPSKAKKNVLTVHDLAFKKFPDTIESKNLKFLEKVVPTSIKNANHIIAVSENTKKDIVEYYGVPEGKITVVYNGISDDFSSSTSESFKIKTKHKFGLNKPYILSVNTIEPRKNLGTLIAAYAKLNKNLKNTYDLVICGGIGWNGEFKKLQSLINQYNLRNKVKLLNFVDSKSLKAIYDLANLYVTPSLYEGFGLGLVEAMAYELPILASDTGCHKEIAKNAAMYFNVNDIQELSLKIELLLMDKEKYDSLKNHAAKRVKNFNWKKSAEKTLEVYKNVLLGY